MPEEGGSGAITAASLAVEFLAQYQTLEAFADGGYAALKKQITDQGGVDIPVLFRAPTKADTSNIKRQIRDSFGSLTMPWEFSAWKTKTDNLKRDITARWDNGPALKVNKLAITPEAGASLRSQIQKVLNSETFTINVEGKLSGVQGSGGSSGSMTGPMWIAPGNMFRNALNPQVPQQAPGNGTGGVNPPQRAIDPATGEPVGSGFVSRMTYAQLAREVEKQDRREENARRNDRVSLFNARQEQQQNLGKKIIAEQMLRDVTMDLPSRRAAMQAEEAMWNARRLAAERARQQYEGITAAADRTASYANTVGVAATPRRVPSAEAFSSTPGQMSLPFVQSSQGQMGLFGQSYSAPMAGGVPLNYQTRREMLEMSAQRAQSLGEARRNMITDVIGPSMWGQIANQRQQYRNDFRARTSLPLNVPVPSASAYPPPTPPSATGFGVVQNLFSQRIMPSIGNFVKRFGDNWEESIRRAEGEARRHMFAGMTLSMAFTYPAMQAGKAGISELSGLDSSMARSAALTSVPADEIKNIRKEIIGMSSDLPQTAKSLSDAFYYIASAGYKGSDSMEVLRAASKGAAGGLGETETVADTTTSVLAAYNMQASKAAGVVDVLTAAVRVGKGEATDYAGAFAKVIPIASQAGISFEQVAASMATMTRIGLNPDETATAFRQLTANLIKPSKESRDTMKQLGTSPSKVREAIRDKGFAATVQELMKLSGGNLDVLDRLIGNIRGLTGYLAVAGNQVDEYNSALKQMNEAHGSTEHAFGEMSKTLEFQWARLLNSGKQVFFQLGSEVVPRLANSVSDVADQMPGHVNTLVSAWQQLPRPLQVLAEAAGVFSVLSGPMLMNISVARNLGAAFLTMAGSFKPLMVVGALAAGLLYFTRSGNEAADSADRQSGAYREGGIASEALRLSVRGLTMAVLGYIAANQVLKTGGALSDGFRAALASAKSFHAGLIAVRSAAQSAFAAEGAKGLMATVFRPSGIPAANRLMTDKAGQDAISAMKFGPAFAGVATTVAGVTAAVGLGAIAWENYAASVNDAKLRTQDLEGTTEQIDKIFSRMANTVGSHNNQRKTYLTGLQTQIGLADTSDKSQRLLGSIGSKIEEIRVRPHMNELDRHVLLRQMDELRTELQQKMQIQLEIETQPGLAEQISNTFRDTYSGVPEEDAEPDVGWIENAGRFFDGIGNRVRGYVTGGNSAQSDLIDAIQRSPLVQPQPRPDVPMFGPPVGTYNEAGAIIDRILGTKNSQFKTDEQIKKAISQVTDLKRLNAAYKALQNNSADAKVLASHSRIGDQLAQRRLNVYDQSQAEAERKQQTQQADMWAAQEADRAARAKESARIAKEVSMWNSYSNVIDGVMGKIREFASRTEEARITNELMKRTFDGISDSARQTAIQLGQVVDKMKALNELRGVTSDMIGQAQSRLIGLGATHLPTTGINRVAGVLDFQNRMRGYQSTAIPLYQNKVRAVEIGQAQRETRINQLSESGIVGLGGSGGPAPSWLKAMEQNTGKTFARNCAEELTARLRNAKVNIGFISSVSTDPSKRVSFDESGRLPAGTIVRWPPGHGGFKKGHYAAVGSDQVNWTESNMRRNGHGPNYISTDRDINYAKLRQQIASGDAYAFFPTKNAVRSPAQSAPYHRANREILPRTLDLPNGIMVDSRISNLPGLVPDASYYYHDSQKRIGLPKLPLPALPPAPPAGFKTYADTPAARSNSFLRVDQEDVQRHQQLATVKPRQRPGATKASIGVMQDFRNSEFDTAPYVSSLPFGIGGGVLPMPGFENRFAFQQALMRKDFLSKAQKGFDVSKEKGFPDVSAAYRKQIKSVEDYIRAMWFTMKEFDEATATQSGILEQIREHREMVSRVRLMGKENDPFARAEEEIRLARQNARPYTAQGASAKRFNTIQEFRQRRTIQRNQEQTMENEAYGRFNLNMGLLNSPELFGDNTVAQYERIKYERELRAELTHDPDNQAGLQNRHTRARTQRDIDEKVSRGMAQFTRDKIEGTTASIRQSIAEQHQALELAQDEERIRRDISLTEDQINVKLAGRNAYYQALNAAQRDHVPNAIFLANEAERAAQATAQQASDTAYFTTIRNNRYQHETAMQQASGTISLLNQNIRPDTPNFDFLNQMSGIETEVRRDQSIRVSHKQEEIARRQELLRATTGIDQLKAYRNAVNEVNDSLATMGDESGLAAQTLQDLRNVILGLPGSEQIDPMALASGRINNAARQRIFGLEQEDAMMRTLTETEKERLRNRATLSVYENNPALAPMVPQLRESHSRIEEATAQREVNQLGYEQIRISADLAMNVRRQAEERNALTELAKQEVAWKHEDLALEQQLARIGRSLTPEDKADININRDIVRQQLQRDEWQNNFQSFGDNIRDSIMSGFKSAAGGVKGIFASIVGNIRDLVVDKGVGQISNWLTSNIMGKDWQHPKDNWFQQVTGNAPAMPGMPVFNNTEATGWKPDGMMGGMFQSILGINGSPVFSRPQAEVSQSVSSPVIGMAGTFLNNALNGQLGDLGGGLGAGLASGMGNTDTVTLNARTVNVIGGSSAGFNMGRRGASTRQIAGGLLGQLLGG